MNEEFAASDGHAELALRLAAMAHPARLEILKRLSANECCCKEVVGGLNLAQSTVSQHLKVLVSAGLVELTPHKQRSVYRIDRKAIMATATAMTGLAESCCTPKLCGGADSEQQSPNGS